MHTLNLAKESAASGAITGVVFWIRPTATTGSTAIMPTVFHQDERYYAMGEGGIWKRGIYAASRDFITPDYHGKNSFNASEILGRGISQGVSHSAYYPSKTQTFGGFGRSMPTQSGATQLPMSFVSFGRTSMPI